MSEHAHPTAARRHSNTQERFYVGRRGERAEVYVVTLRDVERLRPAGRGSHVALDWGPYAAAGGPELAAAVLRHTTGRRPPEQACAQFHLEVVAALPTAGFVVGCDDVALWLAAAEHDPGTWHRERPALHRRLAYALAALGTPFAAHPGARGVV